MLYLVAPHFESYLPPSGAKAGLKLHKPPFKFLAIFVVAITALAFALATLSVQFSNDKSNLSHPTYSQGIPEEFAKINEVWEILKTEHLDRDNFDAEQLTTGAIRGMLHSLDDPYASYLNVQQYSLESDNFKGAFSGIGAQVTIRDGLIIVIAPIPDSPAEAAGILPGDAIIAIDGISTKGYSLLDAVSQIRGVAGEPVELGIKRPSTGETLTMQIVRDIVKLQSITMRMLVGGIAHIRLTTFTDTTEMELIRALDKTREFNAKGLIVDVRDNPGGILRSVIDTTSHFISDGIVLYEIDGHGNRKDWPVNDGGKATDIPLVLLINGYSASGSEVLAGALMDNDRGTVIGVKTFGKGSVNTLRNLSDGSGLYFTIARWYTPHGTLIEGSGLEPNIQILNSNEDGEDTQLDKAIEILLGILGG